MTSVFERVIFDTNVILSAAIFAKSLPARAYNRAIETCMVISSVDTLREMMQTLARPKFDRYLTTSEKAVFLSKHLSLTQPTLVTHTVTDCRDPRDNKFLELALSGQADLILTGDTDL